MSNTQKACRNCGSSNLTWYCDVKNYGRVQDGLIRLHEVGAIAFLGCDECSETLKIIDSDSIAKKLNTLETQRDEARAEVERLRKRVEELEAHPAFVVDLETGKFTPMLSTPTQPKSSRRTGGSGMQQPLAQFLQPQRKQE